MWSFENHHFRWGTPYQQLSHNAATHSLVTHQLRSLFPYPKALLSGILTGLLPPSFYFFLSTHLIREHYSKGCSKYFRAVGFSSNESCGFQLSYPPQTGRGKNAGFKILPTFTWPLHVSEYDSTPCSIQDDIPSRRVENVVIVPKILQPSRFLLDWG